MHAVLDLDVPDYETGIGPYAWLHTRLSECRSRTDEPLPARLTFVRTALGLSDFIEQEETVTDPNALTRFIGHDIAQMARNLSELARIAKSLIPDLRGLSQAEQNNLHQYYKNIFRKV